MKPLFLWHSTESCSCDTVALMLSFLPTPASAVSYTDHRFQLDVCRDEFA